MNQLKHYREEAGLTQAELGERCGFRAAQSRIALYESGGRTPSLHYARRIVAALNEAGAECRLDDVFPPEGFDSDYS